MAAAALTEAKVVECDHTWEEMAQAAVMPRKPPRWACEKCHKQTDVRPPPRCVHEWKQTQKFTWGPPYTRAEWTCQVCKGVTHDEPPFDPRMHDRFQMVIFDDAKKYIRDETYGSWKFRSCYVTMCVDCKQFFFGDDNWIDTVCNKKR